METVIDNTTIKKYPAYKYSGVEWMGEIPSHWIIKRIKHLFTEINERSFDGSEDLLSVSQYTGVTNKSERLEEGGMLTNASTLEGYKKVWKGDLVSNIMLAWNGSLGFSPFNGITSPAYSIYRLKSNDVNRYFHYLLRTELYKSEYKRNSSGVIESRLRLYTDDFFRIESIIPPLPEQTAIAAFLDRKTALIDRAIDIKQKQIELLKERRQILIHKAVTRGLNPNVKMKDSGVEWIGEIPEGWEVLSFRHCIEILTDFTSNGSFASLASNVTYLDEGYSRLIRLTDLRVNLQNDGVYVSEKSHKFLNNSELFGGELLIANVGAYAGLAEIMPKLFYKTTLGPNMLLLRLNQHNPYFYYLINSPHYSSYITNTATATAQPKLNKENIRNIRVIKPPIEEQKEIVNAIEIFSKKFIDAISLKEQEIENLKEYKATLINSAVTGKIRVI